MKDLYSDQQRQLASTSRTSQYKLFCKQASRCQRLGFLLNRSVLGAGIHSSKAELLSDISIPPHLTSLLDPHFAHFTFSQSVSLPGQWVSANIFPPPPPTTEHISPAPAHTPQHRPPPPSAAPGIKPGTGGMKRRDSGWSTRERLTHRDRETDGALPMTASAVHGMGHLSLLLYLVVFSWLSVTASVSLDLTELRNKVSKIKVNPRGNLWATGHFMGKKSLFDYPEGYNSSPADAARDLQTLYIWKMLDSGLPQEQEGSQLTSNTVTEGTGLIMKIIERYVKNSEK
ncbi:neuromedin Ba [Stegostoma tigrinum]|uniref:neuromedin Ba n=1 Tax=Stegostoma tigrinum TaxID=3053191 RepID=UPI00202B8C01|nr:neuromedin Ba [Stegostoma tigrinum]XP_048376765.1 neuromedin Ba [Stegostoma tigrinum]